MADTQQADPTVFVLFGATGDLAHRMVIPAFFRLAQRGLLPTDWRLVGNGRGDVSHEDFRGRVRKSLEEFGPHPDDGPWEEFAGRLHFAGGGFDSADPGSLLDVLADAEKALGGSPQRVHYLAIPPTAFEKVTQGLGEHELTDRARVVYEKPFGTSRSSFQELDRMVHEVLDERQVFRIDHFLGKEASQDLHVARFANGLLSRAWNREHVAAVQVDVPETLDVSTRGDFYDHTGAVLDMLVTHLFQVAAEVAMEPPATLSADDLGEARESVIGSYRPLTRDDVVLGQYDGYQDVDGVAAGSTTETFVAARLWVDTERWRDVPFLLRTGKCMAASAQQVSLVFRDPERVMHDLPEQGNVLTFSLAGDGALDLSVVAKRPGPGSELETLRLERPLAGDTGDTGDDAALPPYARLLHDILLGDRTLFTRPDGLAHVWDVATPLLEDRPDPIRYPRGSWGPAEADALAAPHGWLLPGDRA